MTKQEVIDMLIRDGDLGNEIKFLDEKTGKLFTIQSLAVHRTYDNCSSEFDRFTDVLTGSSDD